MGQTQQKRNLGEVDIFSWPYMCGVEFVQLSSIFPDVGKF